MIQNTLLRFSVGLGFLLPNFQLKADFPQILKEFDDYTAQKFQDLKIPGAAIGILYKNQRPVFRFYGEAYKGKKQPINADTSFQLGSVSKSVFAVLAAMLQKEGKLSFEDPLQKYVPNLQNPNLLESKIKHILSHTTGLQRQGFNQKIESLLPLNTLLNALEEAPAKCPAGTCFDYHNAAYGAYLTPVLEKASHLSLNQLFTQKFNQTVGMRRTSMLYETLIKDSNRAQPHVKNEEGVFVPCKTFSKGYYTVAPAGGVNSTPRDMMYFLKLLLGGMPQVLSRSDLNTLYTPRIETPDQKQRSHKDKDRIKNAQYGYGFRLLDFAGEAVVFHGSWVKGFVNTVALLPQHDVGIFILTNCESRFSFGEAMKFFDLVLSLPEKDWLPVHKKKAKLTPQSQRKHKKIKRKTV
jgi:beta-lactamase class C